MILMEKKNFNEISITELTKKAGVSRMAYYRNYNIKEDIIVQYLDELFEEYLNARLSYEKIYIYQNVCLYFAYFRRHEKLILNLINSNLTHLILERYDKYLHVIFENMPLSQAASPEQDNYIIGYIAGGLYKVLIEWVKNGLKESDEEMAEIIIGLTQRSQT
jgi:AcrR family transcriptional regulator